jgi:hypothetical protein
MILAGYYVIKNLLLVLDRGDLTESKDLFDKFSRRYLNDEELQRIFDEFNSYLKIEDSKKLDNIKAALRELGEVRKREASGGTELWLKDRRPGVMQLIRIV